MITKVPVKTQSVWKNEINLLKLWYFSVSCGKLIDVIEEVFLVFCFCEKLCVQLVTVINFTGAFKTKHHFFQYQLSSLLPINHTIFFYHRVTEVISSSSWHSNLVRYEQELRMLTPVPGSFTDVSWFCLCREAAWRSCCVEKTVLWLLWNSSFITASSPPVFSRKLYLFGTLWVSVVPQCHRLQLRWTP